MSNLLALGPKLTTPLPRLSDDLYRALSEASLETHPNELKPDLEAWHHLRLACFPAGLAALPGPDAVRHLALQVLPPRRSSQGDEADGNAIPTKTATMLTITFPWSPLAPPSLPSPLAPGTISPATTSADASLASERLAVLYSLAYVHAALGASTRRADEQGIRAALAAFQNAAGTLQVLASEIGKLESRKGAAVPVAADGGGEAQGLRPDLRKEVVACLEVLCLAQAQEVAWQKAVMDRLKNGTVAKVAMHAAQLYQQARDQAESIRSEADVASFAFADDLSRYLAFKHAHFAAVAHYRRSLDDLGANRYGDELGRLRLCDQVLKEVVASKGKRGVPDAVVKDLKSLQGMITENLARANKDNDLIYLATPTASTLLPPIVPFPLAKPLIAAELADPLGYLNQIQRPGWLRALVPRRTRDALELWEDRKMVWYGEVVDRGAKKLETEANSCLAALNLPAALEAVQQPIGVPATLVERSEHIRTQGGLAKLETMMKDVRRVATVNRRLVEESHELLAHEADLDSTHRQTYGTRSWTRDPSAEVSAPLAQRADQLEAVLNAAGESDGLVRAKFGEWEETISVLDQGQAALEDAIPNSSTGSTSTARSPELQKASRQLRASLENLADLCSERDKLIHAARTRLEQASIRTRLERDSQRRERTLHEADEGNDLAALEDLLTDELAKVGAPFEQDLQRSRARQEDLLDQIKQQNGAFVAAREAKNESHEREEAIRLYETAAAKYDEMLNNLHEGLKFYADLSRLLGELLDAVKAHVHAREAQAAQMDAQLRQPPVQTVELAKSTAPELDQDKLAPPVPVTAAAASPRRTSPRSPAKRKTEKATRAPVAEPSPASSGWDPSQGIRFG
ncbi:hypothetical protein BMF94_1502 [Rhodotorula taiwanensis]|uniref:BRO1 domain-containing protein n=1 Tax=Rhodotorula taiwanensis TaxID=741276 RepID=A0A2S5BF87_9BASI|nr:hypothetical protein BMF94_1502 [Rhodotorula taiwanensis]